MRLPSVKTLMELTEGDKVKALRLRAILEEPMRVQAMMEACNKVLGTYGVECIDRGHNSKSPSIMYCNMGDPYTWTLLYYSSSFHVGCWGDIVERGHYD